MGDLKARQDPISGVVTVGEWRYNPRWHWWYKPDEQHTLRVHDEHEVPPEVVEAVFRLLGWA